MNREKLNQIYQRFKVRKQKTLILKECVYKTDGQIRLATEVMDNIVAFCKSIGVAHAAAKNRDFRTLKKHWDKEISQIGDAERYFSLLANKQADISQRIVKIFKQYGEVSQSIIPFLKNENKRLTADDYRELRTTYPIRKELAEKRDLEQKYTQTLRLFLWDIYDLQTYIIFAKKHIFIILPQYNIF